MRQRVRLEKTGRTVPLRMCVGCRTQTGRTDLLRCVVVDGAVVPDPARRLPGRGAYIHRDQRCWELARKRKAWSRAFKTTTALDTSPVAEWVPVAP